MVSHFDLAEKKHKIAELDSRTLEEGFWNDPSHAQGIIRQLNGLKDIVGAYEKLNATLSSLEETGELLKDDFDPEIFELYEMEYQEMETAFDDFEIKVLLSHEYDHSSAILELHPGAGGTESCDWADMLYRMYSRCDGVDFLKKVGRLYPSAQGGKAYKILSIRPQGQMALLQLEGVSDMDAARALRGQVFYFDRNDATLPAGRWYVADLIGCEVRDADTGKVYGVVTSVDHPGAQDIYTVKAPGGKEYMFPGVDAFLKERNPPEGYILVTPIPGLLDDDFDSEREEE